MTSVVFYRWRSAKTMDEIRFNGVSIRLIDLKRAIIDRKGLDKGKGMDFELEVMDESTQKVYTGDDALVPKNSTLVVKRVPAIGAGLLSRLRQQGHRGGAPAASLQPILVQGKQEVAEPSKPAAPTAALTTAASTAVSAAPPAPTPGEATALAAPAAAPTPAPAQEAQVIDELKMIQSLQASDTDRNRQGNRVWTSGEKRPAETSQSHHTRKPMSSTVPPPNYVCHRCGRPGHYIQHCPTNNDPRFNKPPAQKPQQRMLGVPTTAVTKVQDLAEVDTHGKLVFQTSDGYNVVQPSQHNFEHLIKLGGGASSILKDIPDDLKCAFSHKLLQRAVRLPCCGKSVDDESIRSELLNTHYQCPLCGESISPESLTPDLQKRAAVEEFLRQAASAASDDTERATVETSDLKEPPGAPEGAPRMPFEDDRRADDYRPSMPFEGDMPLPPMGMPPFFPMGPPPHMGMMPPPPEAMGIPWMDPMMDPMMMGMMGPMGMMPPMGMPPPFGFPMGPPMSEEEFRRHQAEMRRRGMGPPGPDRRGRPPRDGPPPPRPPRDHDRREPPPSYGADRRGHDAPPASAAGGEASQQQQQQQQPPPPPPPPPPGEPPAAADNREARRTDSSRERPRSRERSRDRDRGRDRSRDRSRDRGRERRRSRDDRNRDDRDRRRRRDDSRERSRGRRSRSRDDSNMRRSSKHSASPAKDVKEETTTSATTETTTATMPEKAPDGFDARERRQANGTQKHRSRSRSRSRDRRRSDDREAKRSRHERDRDHDRDRERERERDRDRERDRHRERDRDGDSRSRAENGVKTVASSIDRRDRPSDRSRTRDYEKDDKNRNRDKDRTREPYNDRSRERTSGSERERWAMEG